MTTDILSAISIGFFLSFVLGPVFFVLIETSISKGFKAAITLNSGVILSDIIFIIIGYFSSKQLVENINNQPGLFVLGGVVLVIYGVFIFINRNKKDKRIKIEAAKENYLNLFLKGFGLNIINIAVLMFWVGVILVVVPTLQNNNSIGVFSFFSTILATYFCTDIVKILIAKRVSSAINTENTSMIKIILSLILFISGIVIIYTGINF
jgi:threonine/homoserine/homoserine lactone efflux protein